MVGWFFYFMSDIDNKTIIPKARAVSEIRMNLEDMVRKDIPEILEKIHTIKRYLDQLESMLVTEGACNGRT